MILLLLAQAVVAPSALSVHDPVDRSQPGSPLGNLGRWVTNDDYPPRAMFEEREGTTGFKLHYDAGGMPTECEIISSSGHADLDATTCRLVQARARFAPGRDRRGEPAGGTYANRVRWQIPGGYLHALARAGFHVDDEREALPRGPQLGVMPAIDSVTHYPLSARAARQEGDVRMKLDIDPAGKLTRCVVTETSMVADLDAAACDLVRKEGRFRPALDSKGAPVRGTLPAVFRWVLPRGAVDATAAVSVPPVRKFPLNEDGDATMSILLGADGKVVDCRVSGSERMERVKNPCDQMIDAARYIPFVDADGRAIAKRITMRTVLTIEDADAPEEAVGE